VTTSAASAVSAAASHRPSARSVAHRISIHSVAVAVRNHVPALEPALRRALGEFEIAAFPAGFTAIECILRHYDKQEVLKHLSSTATPITGLREGLELYQENERFWLIDDRWGLIELNMLKGQWKGWILPEPAVDLDRVVELAVTWPMAQLLRARGLHMQPAASVVRGNFGMLIISPFSVEPELTALLRAGFRLVGQRWSALRDDGGRIQMLHFPGSVERAGQARIDLEGEFPGAAIGQGECNTVVLIEPGRRHSPHLRRIAAPSALPALRRAWPIVELHPNRLNGQMPAKLARRCQVYSARLTERPQDLLDQLGAARDQDFAARAESAAIKQTARLLDRAIARSSSHAQAG
jgi:hypothetical protein